MVILLGRLSGLNYFNHMQYIEAVSEEAARYKSVFLAGGITNCADWQKAVVDKLSDLEVTVYNPRRANYPMDDPAAAAAQITWEYDRLHKADTVSFWFSKETLNPITLFELGAALERSKPFGDTQGKPVVIGVDPEYQRKQDVEVQTKLIRPDITVCYSVEELAEQIRGFFK